MKSVVYVRCSSRNQSNASQLKPLMEYVKNSNYELVEVVEDVAVSGAVKGRSRKGFSRVMELVNQRLVDVVVIYSVDRIGRNMGDVISLVEELDDKGVGLVIYKNAIDTTTQMGKTLVGFFALVAQMERDFLISRVKDGIAASAKKSGRRTISKMKQDKIISLRNKGLSMNKIARELRVGNSQVMRVIHSHQ